MQITNRANLPDAIVRAVVNDPYPYGKTGDISVTRLIDAPQIRLLTRAHWAEIEEDASERIWALLGQAVHSILERAETQALTEERLFAEIEGWSVSGQFDRLAYFPTQGLLQDYKVTSAWSVLDGPKPEWVRQLNALRYLATKHGYPVSRLQVVAILRDWSRGKAQAGGNYPQAQVVTLEIPVWPMHETDAYLRERVHLHQLAELQQERGGPGSECTPEERWEKPATFAVRKSGRKTAVRVFDTEAEAQTLAATLSGGYVETRPGASVRCADYCAVRGFCAQRARLQACGTDEQEEAA